jgi:sensor histidine kinase YesM
MHLSSRWIWVLFTPVIVLLSRRFPIAREGWQKSLFAHFGAFMLFSSATALLAKLLAPVLGTPPRAWSLPVLWFMQLYYSLINYAAVAAVAHAIEYYRRYAERQRRAAQLELESARLESQITRARLDMLKAQLQPHFLFNTLHAISELIHEHPATADRMVTRLGDLLRMSMDDGDRQEVTLRKELSLLDAYLDIQKVRHVGRLEFHATVGAETLEARVPPLLLQPLVENAIRYGITSQRKGCVVQLS